MNLLIKSSSIDTLSSKYESPPLVIDFHFLLIVTLAMTEFNFLQMHVFPIRVKMAAPVPVVTQQISSAVALQNMLVMLVKHIKVKITGLWDSKSQGPLAVLNIARIAWRVARGV